MNKSFLIFILLLSQSLFSHPNGTYTIDSENISKKPATVTFQIISRCPVSRGSMRGFLRTLTFNSIAINKYGYASGHYVESHTEDGEKYVEVNEDCIRVEEGLDYEILEEGEGKERKEFIANPSSEDENDAFLSLKRL